MVGVKEFEVAKAVINKQLAVLSEGVPTWEGRWHLFDMCLYFGHVDVAWAMAEAGTQGCAVEDYHLGPYAQYIEEYREPFWFDDGVESDDSNAWGFPSFHGILMKDSNNALVEAEKAAKKASVRPLFMRILECFCAGLDPPFAVSDGAMARLLDIAIFIGDPEAASMLAGLTQARPLRRWEQNFFLSSELHVDYGRPILRRRGALLAALAAGGNFESEDLLTREGGWHLFDMCLLFGHVDVAWAMAEAGTKGCVLEDCHLGPYAEGLCWEDEGGGGDPPVWTDDWPPARPNLWRLPSTQGIRMKDSDYQAEKAEEAAQEASERPLFMRILECYRAGLEPPFAVSDSAMARLLDITLFIGDQNAASMLAGLTRVRPMRFQRTLALDWFFFELPSPFEGLTLRRQGPLLAALAAGANFEAERIDGCTLREALVFGGAEWKDFAHLVPDEDVLEDDCWPDGFFYGSFTEGDRSSWTWTLSSATLWQCKLAELALEQIEVQCSILQEDDLDPEQPAPWQSDRRQEVLQFSLLDVAILQGQPESAVICAAAGVGVKALQMLSYNDKSQLHLRGRQGDWISVPLAPMADRRDAACHAARTALRLALRRLLGRVLCKVSPAELVPRILAFAMEEPDWLRALMEDFLAPEDVVGWEQYEPTRVAPAVKVPEAEAEPAQMEVDAEEPSGEAGEVDERATDYIMTALRESQAEVAWTTP